MAYNIYDDRIKNYEDAKLWESLVRLTSNRPMSAERKERHDEIKRALRKFYHKSSDGAVNFGEWDSFISKYPLPGWIKTKEEAIEFFEEYEWMRCTPSQYDCTGQMFTYGYCVFQKSDGRWWVYHRIALDV